MDLASLESLYLRAPLLPAPRGRFRGEVLARIPNRGSRRLLARAVEYVGFELAPFGVDFDAARWFFVHPRVRALAFELRAARSRWRDTEALAFDYGPRAALLYDEVKPLSDALCLGLGGTAAPAGEGDHVVFALARAVG